MATANRGAFSIISQLDPVFSYNPIVASGAAVSIAAGSPTKNGTSGAVAAMVDGDGTTSQLFTGIAKSDSTDTASVAGRVQVWLPVPGLLYAGKAKTASLANTQALIDGLVNKRVVFDLTSTTWTVDTAAADATTNGLHIIGGDYRTSTINFIIGPNIAWANPTT